MSAFVHLHVHSDYSILDGACKIDRLLDRVADLDMPAVALTDHGVMSGAVQLYRQAHKRGLTPVIGLEAADFEVFEDGQPMKVLGVDYPLRPERVGAAISTLKAADHRVFLEVGPGPSLCNAIRYDSTELVAVGTLDQDTDDNRADFSRAPLREPPRITEPVGASLTTRMNSGPSPSCSTPRLAR